MIIFYILAILFILKKGGILPSDGFAKTAVKTVVYSVVAILGISILVFMFTFVSAIFYIL